MKPTRAALGQLAPEEQEPCSGLAADLLQMYVKQECVDVHIKTRDGPDVGAHIAILTTRSPYFLSILGKQWRAAAPHNPTIDMSSFVHFHLMD
jgi:hypothetical protein